MAQRPPPDESLEADDPNSTAGSVRATTAASVPPVVGVGASAGGISAYRSFVKAIPAGSGIAWVLIQHMAPARESQLREILQRETELPVVEVTSRMSVAPDHVYVIAPGRTMTIKGGTLMPVADHDPLSRRTSIDAFFLSLSEDQGEHAGCALLSGAGTDGTIGLKSIKEAGGLTLTQTLGEAEYDSMLLSAVRTGLVDRELSVEDMPGAFVEFLVRRAPISAEAQVQDGERLEVCKLLREATGHDFSGYKSSTVDRRIRRRMQMAGTDSLAAYLERLRENKAEAINLFRDLLIGVTQFFRDPDAFIALAQSVIPKLLAGKTEDDEIRVWVPGCATGEEAYSLAMLFQEQTASLPSVPNLKIFGSDIDDNALHFARLGRYPKGIAADVSPERLERFFDSEDGTYCIRSQLREMCLFAQHNMLRDPPFSRIDLISCRNVLIYMNADLQRRLAPVFHYSLKPEGYILFGPAESPGQPKLFRETDRKHRIFQRIGESARLPDFPIAAGDGRDRALPRPSPGLRSEEVEGLSGQAARRVLADFAPAYVVIDTDYDILEASTGTGEYLELPGGRPRMNLGAMARSGLAVDVRAAVAKVMATGQRETRTGLTIGSGDQRRQLTLTVEPLPSRSRSDSLYLVVFQDGPVVGEPPTTRSARRHDDEVARALEIELQTTKERLQSTLEELETSNEELKASNEELSSVNEELQSSNEELETSKEELQSINEELRTVNNELSSRVDDLARANNDLKNLFANTEIAMLFLDQQFRIMNFTPSAKPLFHLRDHDIGRPLDELAGRLDFKELKAEVEAVVAEGTGREREVQTNGGETPRTFILRILPYRDDQNMTGGAVLTLIDISERKRSEERLSAMVSELNHRVKNALAVVLAVIHQTKARGASSDEFAEIVEGRVNAMAAAHNLLSERAWERAGLDDVARRVLLPFAEADSDRLTLVGSAIELRPAAVVSVGLILHELATNAAKYGAWSTAKGAVVLRWEYVLNDPGTLRVIWKETGGPPATAPAREGFGLRFVRRSAEFELHGRCQPDFGANGFECVFELPADGIRWQPSAGRRSVAENARPPEARSQGDGG